MDYNDGQYTSGAGPGDGHAAVVAIHEDQAVFIGDSEVEVSQWVHKTALTPMPLVFRVPREKDLHTIL